jgi:hypothetical protein
MLPPGPPLPVAPQSQSTVPPASYRVSIPRWNPTIDDQTTPARPVGSDFSSHLVAIAVSNPVLPSRVPRSACSLPMRPARQPSGGARQACRRARREPKRPLRPAGVLALSGCRRLRRPRAEPKTFTTIEGAPGSCSTSPIPICNCANGADGGQVRRQRDPRAWRRPHGDVTDSRRRLAVRTRSALDRRRLAAGWLNPPRVRMAAREG